MSHEKSNEIDRLHTFPQSVSLPQIWMGLTRVLHPFTSSQWSCHLTIVLCDKSIPNDSNYQIRKAIMTKMCARGPEIPGGWLLPATCNCYFSIPTINHVTGGSKYWIWRHNIFCRLSPQRLNITIVVRKTHRFSGDNNWNAGTRDQHFFFADCRHKGSIL